jgi:phosphoadenosine phosphosulfate reductase
MRDLSRERPPLRPRTRGSLTAQDTLRLAVERHHPRLVMACSFQKEESVLIDMLLEIEPSARVFTIDTGVLFPETYSAWRAVEDRYGLKIEVLDAAPPNGSPWSAANCCGNRKVEALGQALADSDAWITGIRREQSQTRSDAQAIEWDAARAVWKFNPLVAWGDDDVWAYVRARDLPYNPLHDSGYSSIGCAPCTLPGAGREGRWAGEDKTECGLHA